MNKLTKDFFFFYPLKWQVELLTKEADNFDPLHK